LVIGNVISDESEWRTFSDRRGDDPNRVGGPEIGLLADAGLATLMGDNPNGMGNSLAKLQNANALSKNHRKLVDAFRRSSAMAALLHLPNSLKTRSDELYKRVLELGIGPSSRCGCIDGRMYLHGLQSGRSAANH